jgi:CheY-like chemotaxis protein
MANSLDHSTGRKKVLVIASSEWASAIYEGLSDYIIAPAPVPIESNDGGDQRTVSWLCSQMFPSPKEPPKTSALSRARKALWDPNPESSIEPLAPTPAAPINFPMSLFNWGAYDFVIIQDIWRLGDGNAATMEGAGYVLANLDYYLWGNFKTKKIILVTDPQFLHKKAEWLGVRRKLSLPAQVEKDLLGAFDSKQAFERVDLNKPGAMPIQRIKELIAESFAQTEAESPANQPRLPHSSASENISSIADAFLHETMTEALRALRSYVKHHAEVIVVDDELVELDNTFAELTGEHLKLPSKMSLGSVAVASASRRTVTQAKTFGELVKVCAQEFQDAFQGGKRYALLVTDILFRGPNWHQTGLDLIETLRDELRLAQNERRVGIVAFTAFTTPFIAMCAYQRGADFVVSKTALGGHDLKMQGTDRLMMTLAFLCFQKSFLFEQRSKAGELIMSTESQTSRANETSFELLRQMLRILPKYAVSMHLHQEWLDTSYLLEAINVYGSDDAQLRSIYKQINGKYE